MEDLGYKDVSELKKELEGMKGKKDISTKELYDAVQRLSQTMADMLEVFGAAADQMKLEEQGFESNTKKHEMIISKLDKLIDQNKTIAEGMVAIVEMVKERIVAPAKEREEPVFRPRPEPRPFMRPQQEWQPRTEPAQRTQPMMAPPQMPVMAPPPTMPNPDFGMPPMQPTPSSDLEFPDLGLDEEEPRKKGLFGMFKK
ncbi:hypothetical protein HYX08_05025 [Candidatus Woesearchaeota archaeon]|nr:hypothetical protein [Candidatus Woesearchaeota archaeon]